MAFGSYGSPGIESALNGTPETARAAYDPLRFCVYTTIALLSWLVSPPVVVTAMSGVGFYMYARAIRGGLTRSKCVLRRPRLVLLYLAALFVVGVGAVAARILR